MNPATADGGEAGFTLVELLVVILIMGVVGGITVSGLVGGYRTSTEVQGRLDTHAMLQDSQIDITRRIRSACPVISVGPYDTTVLVRNSDGTVERYRFHLPAGGVLYEDRDRWNGTTWDDVSVRPVADTLDNLTAGIPVFTGIDDQGAETTAPIDVRQFRTRLQRTTPHGDPVLVTTSIALRNGDALCPSSP